MGDLPVVVIGLVLVEYTHELVNALNTAEHINSTSCTCSDS